MAMQKQGGQLKPTYTSLVRIWGVALGTCQKRLMIGRGGERGSGISMLVARQDDGMMNERKENSRSFIMDVTCSGTMDLL